MANSVLLTGRITKDLELKQAGQTNKCDFTLAVDREFAKENQQKTDFINVTCFAKTAENLCKYQAKGYSYRHKIDFNLRLIRSKKITVCTLLTMLNLLFFLA